PWTAAAVEQGLRRSDSVLSVTEVFVAPVDLAQYDALLDGKEADDGRGAEREGDVAGVPEGATPADLPEQLRGGGAAGAAGGAELRALPLGAGPAGGAGASQRPHRPAAAAVAVAAGEELAGAGPEAGAAQG